MVKSRVRRWLAVAAAAVAATGLQVLVPATAHAVAPGWFMFSGSSTTRVWCLDVQAETAGNVRTNVQIFSCRWIELPGGNLDYQLFTEVPIANDPNIKFKNKATNKCLTYNVNGVPSSSPATAVWAESCDKDGQGWNWDFAGGGWNTWKAVQFPGMCLNAQDISKWGTGVDLFPCNTLRYSDMWQRHFISN